MSVDDEIAEAWAAADAGDPREVVRFFEDFHAADPADPVRRFELASAYDRAGREAEAIGHYEAALAGGLPTDRDRRARIQLGSSLRNVGRAGEAVEVLRGVAGDDPVVGAAARCFLALALTDDGRPNEAVSELLGLVLHAVRDEDLDLYRPALRRYARDLRLGEQV